MLPPLVKALLYGWWIKALLKVTSTDVLLETLFDLNILHQNVAEPVQPPESGVVGNAHRGQVHTQVHAVNQITVTADGAGNLLAPVSGAVEGLLNGLH